ncbi:MAG: hypothetical protein OYG32_14245 [Rhodospirillaceae bacterium]|nr:hypothetical protein [Rhodospirillaceae bacterium]MDE0255948.1 hypothetical protein [Rhodospirillaceae bacterium]MDE0616003.1 hypothetical protein [Rhodospirillaceae bacterium]
MIDDWTYRIEIVNDVRIYPGDEKRFGAAWVLVRTTSVGSAMTSTESIVVSPDVFLSDEEAKRDALEKLSILVCPIEVLLPKVIKSLLDA